MRLKRKDMISFIKNGFNDYGYKSAINKRLFFGFNTSSLTDTDCSSLNSVVKELDNHMLNMVDFDPIMTTDNFDQCICRLLYVSGRWIELCFYNMLIMNDIRNEIVNIDYSTAFTTTIYVYFRYESKTIKMCVDDEKIAIKIETYTIQEKEF